MLSVVTFIKHRQLSKKEYKSHIILLAISIVAMIYVIISIVSLISYL